MMKKLFIIALLTSGAGTASSYAQTILPVPPAASLQKPLILTPKTKDSTGVDLIQQSKPAMLNQTVATPIQQADNIPPAVMKEFTAVMPNTSNVSWNVRDNYYEVEFTSNGIDKIRVYDNRGDLQEIGVKQDVKSIPAAIKPYIKKNYSNEAIANVYKGYSIGRNNGLMTAKPIDSTATGKSMDNKNTGDQKDKPKTDLSFYRVTTTNHLLYFDSDGKFNHEGYSVLTSGL